MIRAKWVRRWACLAAAWTVASSQARPADGPLPTVNTAPYSIPNTLPQVQTAETPVVPPAAKEPLAIAKGFAPIEPAVVNQPDPPRPDSVPNTLQLVSAVEPPLVPPAAKEPLAAAKGFAPIEPAVVNQPDPPRPDSVPNTLQLVSAVEPPLAPPVAQEPIAVAKGIAPSGPAVINQPEQPRLDAARQEPEPGDTGFAVPVDVPPGFAGHSSVAPSGVTANDDFVPVEDRWRLGYPSWDRYSKGHPLVIDYPYDVGSIWNPYRQNVLKGDYPIIGQNTFLIITASSIQSTNAQQVPIAQNVFESTARPNSYEFFGSPNQLAYSNILSLDIDLNHGDAAFKPTDWRVHLTPTFNVNTLNVDELGVTNPNVTKGTQRDLSYFTLQEYFVEFKLADTSPNYDFASVRLGNQEFNADFRGFLFDDTNRGARLFGTALANRVQYNLVFFRQDEKDTDSGLNTFADRGQDVAIANVFLQDFIFPGYTIEGLLAFNHDPASIHYNTNSVLVRPDPDGVAMPHGIDVGYIGFGTDGHIDRFNITSQFYQAIGHDSLNPIANHGADITAEMVALELSYDRDWARFRTSFFWASGSHNPNSGNLNGFDGIIDSPNFAGGEFSYWQTQQIKLFGVNLKNADSLLPSLNADKFEGQANFNNPGLLLFNVGVDFELTPKLKMVNNVNWLWFESTKVLQQFTFDGDLHTSIGTDLSSGFEYRPFDSQNVVVLVGASTLIPSQGFKALYDPKEGSLNPLVAGFVQLNLVY